MGSAILILLVACSTPAERRFEEAAAFAENAETQQAIHAYGEVARTWPQEPEAALVPGRVAGLIGTTCSLGDCACLVEPFTALDSAFGGEPPDEVTRIAIHCAKQAWDTGDNDQLYQAYRALELVEGQAALARFETMDGLHLAVGYAIGKRDPIDAGLLLAAAQGAPQRREGAAARNLLCARYSDLPEVQTCATAAPKDLSSLEAARASLLTAQNACDTVGQITELCPDYADSLQISLNSLESSRAAIAAEQAKLDAQRERERAEAERRQRAEVAKQQARVRAIASRAHTLSSECRNLLARVAPLNARALELVAAERLEAFISVSNQARPLNLKLTQKTEEVSSLRSELSELTQADTSAAREALSAAGENCISPSDM